MNRLGIENPRGLVAFAALTGCLVTLAVAALTGAGGVFAVAGLVGCGCELLLDRTEPGLMARLGRLQPHTRVSLGGFMAEQASRMARLVDPVASRDVPIAGSHLEVPLPGFCQCTLTAKRPFSRHREVGPGRQPPPRFGAGPAAVKALSSMPPQFPGVLW